MNAFSSKSVTVAVSALTFVITVAMSVTFAEARSRAGGGHSSTIVRDHRGSPPSAQGVAAHGCFTILLPSCGAALRSRPDVRDYRQPRDRGHRSQNQ